MKFSKKHFLVSVIILGGIFLVLFFTILIHKTPAPTFYTFPLSTINYLDSLEIPNNVYISQYLTLDNESQQDETVAKAHIKALQIFYERTKSTLEKTPPILKLRQHKGTKINIIHYRQLLINQMNAIRAFSYYISHDIARNDKTAALKHFLLVNQLAEIRLGKGEKLIYWRILANITFDFECLMDNFTFTDNELSLLADKWKRLLSEKQNRLLQPNESDLMLQIGGEEFKNRREKNSFFPNQKKALTHAECAFLGICVLQYRRETEQWPSKMQNLVPRFLDKTDLIKLEGFKFKTSKDRLAIYADIGQEKPDFTIASKNW